MWSIFDEYIAKVDCCINHLHHFCNFETSRLNIGSCVQFGGMSPDTHWIQHEILVQIGIIQYSTRQYWPTMFAFTHQKLPCVSIAVIFGYRIRPPLSVQTPAHWHWLGFEGNSISENDVHLGGY